MEKVLVAGATGYLGASVCAELSNRDYYLKVIARDPAKINSKYIHADETLIAEITEAESLSGCCANIDVVISTLGITRQKDGLTYMDVDYQANLNLLLEAKKSGVKKFIYVSVLNGENLRHLKICEAKERFVDALKLSGLDYCIVRPNGFFSDMSDFLNMAKKGTVYLFGNGEYKTNPIHSEDLATVCVDAINATDSEIDVGGPETLTHNEIARLAFDVQEEKPNITYIPNWIRLSTLFLVRLFTSSQTYGPIEFFMTVMAMDMLSPEKGEHTLREHFEDLNIPNS